MSRNDFKNFSNIGGDVRLFRRLAVGAFDTSEAKGFIVLG
jgi:hypothetical protein